ncbi:MAG TPA: PQQ-dependent sugar dehydrogenase [Gemmatimonadota bacterium]|nr:PQQ-dependent sugar dehydrogenase [Gemmatimonadota bacterium]
MKFLHELAFFVLLASAASCDGNGNATEPPDDGEEPPVRMGLETVVEGLDFPVWLTSPPDDPRLFVVEKDGQVVIVENGAPLPNPFLDLSGQVSTGSEQGLLSLAFHPDYAANGRFFVNFTDPAGDTRVVEYRVSSADPDRADPGSARVVLSIEQPFSNHNGGLVLFGPDGMLYVGMGDGGSGGDPQGNGQDLGALLGKMLRIDVDGGQPYASPQDNPFVETAGARPEVWAYGLRNPWRFSFDRETGDLYIADVGQNRIEEVNAVSGAGRGLNYGWNVMEGTSCFEPREGCDQGGLTLPVTEYDHSEGCSVTGGYVYRGAAIPDLRGTYLYSDYCSGFVSGFRFANGHAENERRFTELEPADHSVSSFGEDAAGELYIVTAGGGVYKIVPE